MLLHQKIKTVNHLFKKVDIHTVKFQKAISIKCITGCGKCCTKSDIESTVLEFLPAAYHLYLTGESQKILNMLETKQDSICIFYNPFLNENFCSIYKYRGLLCRLFGFSVTKDKYGENFLATCKPIKESVGMFLSGKALAQAPNMIDYYIQLYGIDSTLAIQYMPINDSIKKALEIVLSHFQYRKKRA